MMASRRNRDELSFRRRRRFSLKPLIVVLLIAGVLGLGGYWYVNPQSAPSFVRAYLPKAPVRLYKWQDEAGQIRYSNQPPPAGIRYEMVDYWEDANVIPGLPRRE